MEGCWARGKVNMRIKPRFEGGGNLKRLSRSNWVQLYLKMSRERHLLTQAQLRKEYEKDHSGKQSPEKYYTTIGLVVDCSNVYRYETSRDFTQKFKIIDSSNSAEPLQVYLWSNRREDFSLNVKVGDILFINNFKVDIFRDALQAKKAYKVEDSYFRIFSGNPDLSNYSPIDKKVGLDDEDGRILTALNDLRKFSRTYFKNNRVPLMFKQEGKEKKGEAKKVTSSDFDLILRVLDSVEVVNYFRLRLTNDKDEYSLNYPRNVDPGVYKIRSVAEAKWEEKHCSLAGNDYTYFLEISPWMKSYDPKEWDKLVPSPDAVKRKVKRAKIETKLNLTPKRLKDIKKLTLRELFSKDDHTEEVRVSGCEVVKVMTSFQKALKKYDADNHTEKSHLSETGEYIYSIHLLLSDGSLNGEVCNAYIYTYDGRGLEFLPELNPQAIYGRNTLDMKENYDNFVNRVLEESNFDDVPLELILSPMYNGKETIYRIVDTQLLF